MPDGKEQTFWGGKSKELIVEDGKIVGFYQDPSDTTDDGTAGDGTTDIVQEPKK